MILYTNGDSHTAAAEAVRSFGWKGDDGQYDPKSREPHPENLAQSWSQRLADRLGMDLVCEAQSGSSNDRILRTTRQWVEQHAQLAVLVIVQWSTWEREEWLIDGEYYQVNCSGLDHVPKAARQRYKEFIATVDWGAKTNCWHDQIWQLHLWLDHRCVPHVFFNGNMGFNFHDVEYNRTKNWQCSYINAYDSSLSYDGILKSAGFVPVPPSNYHYDAQGHAFWADYLYDYLASNGMIPTSQ